MPIVNTPDMCAVPQADSKYSKTISQTGKTHRCQLVALRLDVFQLLCSACSSQRERQILVKQQRKTSERDSAADSPIALREEESLSPVLRPASESDCCDRAPWQHDPQFWQWSRRGRRMGQQIWH